MTSIDSVERSNFDKRLLEPYSYIAQIPGKQIRTKLIESFNYWLKIDVDKIKSVAEIIEILHNSSLLVDDIEDNSKLRRGSPAAHTIFGIPWTINAANYAYFIGLEKTLHLGHDLGTKVYTEQLLALHQGQGMDIWFRDNYACPTEEEYKTLVIKKTGGLFGLAIRLMQLFSDQKYDFQALCEHLGLLFQIRDDFANLYSKEYTDNKSYCEDLTEGKYSFPIIHAITSHPEDTRLFNIIKQHTSDIELKKYAVRILDEFGSFKYTVDTLVQLGKSALDEIQKAGGNPYLETLVHELVKIVNLYKSEKENF